MRDEKPDEIANPHDNTGKKNIYVCEKCKGHIVTVDLVRGVTPFMIACSATALCEGMMKSSMYRVWDQSVKAGFVWYKPTVLEVLTDGQRSHVDNGGLLLREATSSD